MLRDELRTGVDPLSLKIKKAESLSIANQVAEFERRGGRINCVQQGASGLDGGVLFVPECKGATPINNTTKALAAKGLKGSRASRDSKGDALLKKSLDKMITVRTNIRKTPTGNYELSIAATNYGQFDTLQGALDERQLRRKVLLMPFLSEAK